MNILFVNYHDFSSNSAIHIFNMANKLVDLGVDCRVCVPNGKQTTALIGEAKFKANNYRDFHRHKVRFDNGSGPDLVHAWTPREIVRTFTLKLTDIYGCPYIVHLEDNEEAILQSKYNADMEIWRSLPAKVVHRVIDRDFCHPFKYRMFLDNAAGITAIMDRLLEFKPSHVPGKVVWPGYEEELFHPESMDLQLKAELGIPAHSFVVAYTGNVHHSNHHEVYSLYLAIAALNRKGIPVKLIRTGRNDVEIYDDAVNAFRNCYLELGFIDRESLPHILSLADALVQPGGSGEFNDYRFPSKLPEFFAMARPVILPDTNIAKYLTDGINCVLLKNGDALEIAEKLEFVFRNTDKCKTIGEKGREFASRHFNWTLSANAMKQFYEEVLGNTKRT